MCQAAAAEDSAEVQLSPGCPRSDQFVEEKLWDGRSPLFLLRQRRESEAPVEPVQEATGEGGS